MRPPPSVFFLSLLCGALCLLSATARAQQQEGKVMDRLESDVKQAQNAMGGIGKGRSYLEENREFGDAKPFSAKTAFVRDFYAPQKFHAKDFLTGVYQGSKDFWMGDFRYSTQEANEASKANSNGKKRFATKTSPVKEAHDAGKGFSTAEAVTKKYQKKNSRDKFDLENSAVTGQGWQGGLEVMTIEQVRDLLNKNK